MSYLKFLAKYACMSILKKENKKLIAGHDKVNK